MISLAGFILLLLLTLDPSVSCADAIASRAALVVGNQNYANVTPLRNAIQDAQDMCDTLKRMGYAPTCKYDVATAAALKSLVHSFVGALPAKSAVVLYYAGHAIQLNGTNYLVPVGVAPLTDGSVSKETVSIADLMDELETAKSYVNVVVLDACRNDPWAGTTHRAIAGLAPITRIPLNTIVFYATGYGGFAGDGDGKNGVLTAHLLAALSKPGLDEYEVFRETSLGVQDDSVRAHGLIQAPERHSNFTGEFCFSTCMEKINRKDLDDLKEADRSRQKALEAQVHELQRRPDPEKAPFVPINN
jgi:uncharacterized caspase-like protein